MTSADLASAERARIRALVVLRMNGFRDLAQQYADHGDLDGAHAWTLTWSALRGLLEEIDGGAVAANLMHQHRK